MRRSIPFLDSSTLAWDGPPGGGVFSKTLNMDPVTAAKTVLLRSDPRAVTEQNRRRAHYHDGSEEFLSLGPRFTFDDGVWLDRLAYVHMPPRTVHGSDVQVPDGYLLYLRTVGETEPRFVHDPKERYPFSLDNGAFIITPDALEGRLHQDAALMRLEAGEAALPMDSTRCRELFVVDGEIQSAGLKFTAGCYACYASGEPAPSFTVAKPALVMINLS